MSEMSAAGAGAQPGRAMVAPRRRYGLSPIEALERGFALFQSTFATEAWRYYIGAAPLVLFFVPMWVINGQIQLSSGALLGEAALLTAAYVFRASMVARYVQTVRESAFGVVQPKIRRTPARITALGRLLAWKIALSAAALAALATVAGGPWFYTASQFASLEAQESGTERHSLRGCLALASKWYGASLVLSWMLIPLWIAVWLNGLILAFAVPGLLHSVFGVNTFLSTQMGAESLFRSAAFWFALFGAAWLAIDPVVKCTFVVVYQHLRSRREGDDLRGLLASLPCEEEKKAERIGSTAIGSRSRMAVGSLAVLAALLLNTPRIARAQAAVTSGAEAAGAASAPTADSAASSKRVEALRHALDEESQRAVYRWHDADHPSPPTWFDKFMNKVGDELHRAWDGAWKMVRRLWPQGLGLHLGNGNQHGWHMQDLRLWIGLILALTLAVGGFLFWRRRNREMLPVSVPLATAALPDLSDTAIATERSEDEWFDLAKGLEGQGELRLALRAAYLGLLAGLAQREWLTIRRDRTNREYLDEFTRRWRRRPQAAVETRAEIPDKLRSSLRLFDRVWYGSYDVTASAVAAYRQHQRELLQHV